MRDRKQKIVLILILILILLIVIILISNALFNSDILKVKKVLDEKYDSITCIDSKCNSIIAIKEKKNNTKVKLYNGYGDLVASYKQKSDMKSKTPYALGNDYFLAKYTDSKQNIIYTINDKNGKQLYETKNKLEYVNKNFIVMRMQGKIDYVYTLFDKKGKIKYSNIQNFESYANGKYIYFKSGNNYFLLNKSGNVILQNYKISDSVNDKNNKLLYLILKDNLKNNYYYFDIKKSKIIGESFNTYVKNIDNTLAVTKKEASKKISYIIDENGKKIDSTIIENTEDSKNRINEKIDTEQYYLYTSSVYSNTQNKVLVDNKKDKSFGVLDIKSNKYRKIYSYQSDEYYSTILKLDSTNDHIYVQVSCNSDICENTQTIIYDLTDSKELFKLQGTNLIASDYVQYANGYKVVKYSYQSENIEYRGKYVLYDSNNKELLLSDNQIIIIDSKNVIGKTENESLILYLSKNNKKLNDENSLAKKVEILENDYYEYKNSGKNIIINTKGEKIYSISDNGVLEYDNENIYSINNDLVKIYNIKNSNDNTYELIKSESLKTSSGIDIKPFKNIIFVNNNEENYIKIVNSKGKIIKKMQNAQIMTVINNENRNNSYIISQNIIDNKLKYGLYIVK